MKNILDDLNEVKDDIVENAKSAMDKLGDKAEDLQKDASKKSKS